MNTKNFKLYVRKSKLFRLTISGFSVADTLIFNNKFKLKIVAAASLFSNFRPTIKIKPPKFTISKLALKSKLVSTINVRKISVIASTKAKVKATSTITQSLVIGLIDRVRMRAGSSIKTGILKFTFSPILAKFLLLSDHSSSSLGTLDTKTLAQLDFQTT